MIGWLDYYVTCRKTKSAETMSLHIIKSVIYKLHLQLILHSHLNCTHFHSSPSNDTIPDKCQIREAIPHPELTTVYPITRYSI